MGIRVYTKSFTKQDFPTNGALEQFFALGTYSAVANAGSYQIGFKTSGASSTWYQRACFVRYDTSEIGAGATITDAKVRWRITASAGSPTTWAIDFTVHTWLGSTLDATAADFNPGVSGQTFTYGGSPVGIHERTLNATQRGRINQTGQTDLACKDQSSATFGTDYFQTFAHGFIYPRLIVTWEVDIEDPPAIPHAAI